jgi:hypothetical protein
MSDANLFIPRSAVSAVGGVPKPAVTLGRAALLYLALLPLASTRGIVIRTRMFLSQLLSVSEAEIDEWLSRLEKAGLVIRQTPPPYLVIKLPFWSGEGAEPASFGSEASDSQADVPVSSSKQQPAAAFIKSRASGDGEHGEGVGLRAECREAIGGNDDAIDEFLSQYPESVVRRALARVQATPEKQIRKSKLALFRYLLTKLSAESDE